MTKIERIDENVAPEAMPVEKPAKKEVKGNIRRIFRVENPPMRDSLYTLNIPGRVDNGVSFPAVSKSVKPNHAQQYILSERSQHYAEELAAFRNYEAQGLIKEVDTDEEGKIYIPPMQLEYKKKLDELEALRRKLGGKSVDKNPFLKSSIKIK